MSRTSSSKPLTGRMSIFRNKAGGARVQGLLTKDGVRAFNTHRTRLAKMAGRDVAHVSDADVIEYLSRGRDATLDALRAE